MPPGNASTLEHLDHEQKFMLTIERSNMAIESVEKAISTVGAAVANVERASTRQMLVAEATADALKGVGENLQNAAKIISDARVDIAQIRTSQDNTVQTLVKWIQKLAVFTVVLIVVLILATGGAEYMREAVGLFKSIF